MNQKTIIQIILITFLGVLGCSQNDKAEEEDVRINVEDNYISMFPNLVADSLTINVAIHEIETSSKAKNAFDRWVLKPASDAMSINPYSVVELNREVMVDVKANVKAIKIVAVRWMFMDKESTEAKRYLDKTTALILKWARVNIPINHTPIESSITPIYEAYSIIRNHISPSDRETIDKWIRARAAYYKNLNLTGKLLENNWNTIRISLLLNFSQILDDDVFYNYAVDELANHIELNILENGISHDFVDRDAITYHSYNLLFYARALKAIGMYKGKKEALRFYQYENSKKSSIKEAVNFWEPYLIDPTNNVHLEFVDTQWAPDKSSNKYNKPYNPESTVYVLDELMYIEPSCLSYVDAILGVDKYGRNFNFWINLIK
ncbi:MAG: hypothetical protein COB98_02280 [Flavobacteriaceae bacterium]|nr:MAG: hypothetical protein COB98_02280 [Flavobacteriaceae bacterium]